MLGYFTGIGFNSNSGSSRSKSKNATNRLEASTSKPMQTKKVTLPWLKLYSRPNQAKLVTLAWTPPDSNPIYPVDTTPIKFEKICQASKKRSRPIEEVLGPVPKMSSLKRKAGRPCKRPRLFAPTQTAASVASVVEDRIKNARLVLGRILSNESAAASMSKSLNMADFAHLTVSLGDVQTLLKDELEISNEMTNLCVEMASIDKLECEDKALEASIHNDLMSVKKDIDEIFGNYLNSTEHIINGWSARYSLIASQLNQVRNTKANIALFSLRNAEIKKQVSVLEDIKAFDDEDGYSMVDYIDLGDTDKMDTKLQDCQKNHSIVLTSLETLLTTFNNSYAAMINRVNDTEYGPLILAPEVHAAMMNVTSTILFEDKSALVDKYTSLSARYFLWTWFAPAFARMMDAIKGTFTNRAKLVARLCEGVKRKDMNYSEQCRLIALIEVEASIGDLHFRDLSFIRKWLLQLWNNVEVFGEDATQ